MTRQQLLALGFSAKAIEHRLRDGRLHRARRGVYAVGRPELTQEGRWMAAVLACGAPAALSHMSAAALWGIDRSRPEPIHVSALTRSPRRPPGLVVHRRTALAPERLRGMPGSP